MKVKKLSSLSDNELYESVMETQEELSKEVSKLPTLDNNRLATLKAFLRIERLKERLFYLLKELKKRDNNEFQEKLITSTMSYLK